MKRFEIGEHVYFMTYDQESNRRKILAGTIEVLSVADGLVAVQAQDGTRRYVAEVELFLTRGEAERANVHATKL